MKKIIGVEIISNSVQTGSFGVVFFSHIMKRSEFGDLPAENSVVIGGNGGVSGGNSGVPAGNSLHERRNNEVSAVHNIHLHAGAVQQVAGGIKPPASGGMDALTG